MKAITADDIGSLPDSYYHVCPVSGVNKTLHHYLVMCGHFWGEEGYQIDRLYYKHLLLAYILDGEFFLKYEGKEYRAFAGDTVFIDCQKPHHYGAVMRVEFYFAHFSGGQSHQICADLNEKAGPVLRSENSKNVENSLHYLLYCLNHDKFPPSYVVSSRLYNIMCDLYSEDEEPETRRMYQSISPAFEFIRYNLSNPISTTDMADSVHMSRSYFSRVFSKVTGQSPHDYLIKLRLEMAKQLLATTDMTIKEISGAVGYNSELGFISAFTKNVGTSPGRYRKAPW